MSAHAYFITMRDSLYIKIAPFTTLEDIAAQGSAASDQAYRRDQNPYPKGEARHEWWDSGWVQSLEELCGENNHEKKP